MAFPACWVALAVTCVIACTKSKEPAAAGSAGSAVNGSAVSRSAVSGSAASGSAVAAAAADAGVVGAGSAEAPFQVGDVVWSLWDNGIAYRGKLLAINADGSFQIEWDGANGRNDHWPADLVTRNKPPENPLKVGEVVWSVWNNGIAYRGKLLAINADGSYQIQWDGAGKNDQWPAGFTQRNQPAVEPLKVGERLWAVDGDGNAGRAKIKRINADGTLWIAWDDYHYPDSKDWPTNAVSRTKPAPAPKKPATTSNAGASSKASGAKACNEGTNWTRCGASCFNLQTNNSNCGACGNQCPKTARTCVSGKCTCMSGSYDSDGDCL